MQRQWLEIGAARRTFWLAPAPRPEAPLLVVLHGLGMTGQDMATFTGLARRGPDAGFAVVFPDGLDQRWNDGLRRPREKDLDDTGFITALIGRLAADGVARGGAVYLIGISGGASFAEHLARHALVESAGIVLAAGTATALSRESSPAPAAPAAMLLFEGTADPMVPYEGGEIGPPGLLGHFADRKRGEPRRVGVAVETVAADWAAVNGARAEPSVEQLTSAPGDPPVTRLSWRETGRPPVVLYRIEGGGHGWPGGPQHLPARLIGPVARQLDATGILLEMAQDER